MNIKKSKSFLARITLILVIMIAVLTAVLLMGRYGWKLESEDVATASEDTAIVSEDAVTVSEDTAAVSEVYAKVLDEYYIALNEDWDAAQVMEAGMNYMVADSFFENCKEE